jgi:hypothetical protein
VPTQAPTGGQPTPAPTSGTSNFNPNDVTALLAQKQAFSNANSVNALSSWVQGGNPCDNWGGVTCGQDGAVTALDLTGLGLQGSLAGGLSGAATLQSLKLGQNQLSGSLPGEWAGSNAFQSLTELDVSANRLDGELPDSYGAQGAFSGLQLLRLGSNAFTGSLPPTWGNSGGFGALQNLLVEGNQLTGSLPATWGSAGRFGALSRLDASDNQLQGSIPTAWGGSALPSLTALVLKPGNPTLCGAIPGGLPVLPASAVSGGRVVCGNTPPAPPPPGGQTAAPTAAAASTGGDQTVGAAFDVTGSNLVPWTEASNQTFASAIKFAIGDQFNSTVIRYVGNVPTSSTASGRKLLQSQLITVYYDLDQVSDPNGLTAKLRDQNTLSSLQNALNQNGVSANSVTVNDIQNGGITVPGTSSGGGGGGLSTGAIVGIVIGALAGLLLLVLLLVCCCLRRRKRRRGAYKDPEIVKAGTPIVRPQPTFRNDGDGSPSGGLSYYRKGSPPASPLRAGTPPQGLPAAAAAPIVLNTDNVAYQGQRVNQPMTGPSPRSASPSQSPMYPTVKPTDDLDEAPAPAGKASKFSSWWAGRGAERPVDEASPGPSQSPFSPQIAPEHDVDLDIPQGGGGGVSPGGGSRVAEWLRPGGGASPTGPQPIERTGSQKKKLSSVVSDIDAI